MSRVSKEVPKTDFPPEVAEELGIRELDMLNLAPSTREDIIQARIEARDIRSAIQPHDITGWGDLIQKLEDALLMAKSNAGLYANLFLHLDIESEVE